MLRKHFRIRRIVIGLAFAALAAPTAATAAGTFVDGGPVPVSHVKAAPQIRTEHSASVITPLQADGLRWQAMAARYQALQGKALDLATRDPLIADAIRASQAKALDLATRDPLIADAIRASQAQQATSEHSYGAPAPNPSLVPQVVVSTSTSNGFDWGDAGIGASTAFAVALLLLIAVGLMRRNQHSGLTRA